MKRIIETANSLPTIKQVGKRKINKRKLLALAEKVRAILIKEGKLKENEDIYLSRPLLSS